MSEQFSGRDDRFIEKVRRIIKPGYCETDETGKMTWQMFTASIMGDAETLRLRLEEDSERARLEYWYTPPIHFAVREGHLEATRVLWKAYAYQGVAELLQMAEDRGHDDVVEFLQAQARSVGAEAGDTRLHDAVSSGDRSAVEGLIAQVPALLGSSDQAGLSPLHVDLHKERPEFLDLLIPAIQMHCPEVLNSQDREGGAPLHVAVLRRHETAVMQLLEAGADPNVADFKGFRPIHHAYWRNQYWNWNNDAPRIAELLLKNGAEDSVTLAAARGDLGAVKTFLATDASLANDGDTLEKRPISAAVERGHVDIVGLLLESGANPTLRESRTCLHGSALMAASVNDDVETAAKLLASGANPNGGVDSSGSPASRAGSDRMRGLMYSYGGRPKDLWAYIQSGQFEVVAAILAHSEDPFKYADSEYNSDPYTAIVSGCGRALDKNEPTEKYWAMLEMFLKRKFPMPRVLTECRTYLWHVPAMTRRLLEAGLDPNLPDWQRRTPLHDAAAKPGNHLTEDLCLELAEMFLEFGADINAIDEAYSSTPLGFAARCGHLKMVILLLKKNADSNLAGEPWASPLAWAKRRGHSEIAEALQQYGATMMAEEPQE